MVAEGDHRAAGHVDQVAGRTGPLSAVGSGDHGPVGRAAVHHVEPADVDADGEVRLGDRPGVVGHLDQLRVLLAHSGLRIAAQQDQSVHGDVPAVVQPQHPLGEDHRLVSLAASESASPEPATSAWSCLIGSVAWSLISAVGDPAVCGPATTTVSCAVARPPRADGLRRARRTPTAAAPDAVELIRPGSSPRRGRRRGSARCGLRSRAPRHGRLRTGRRQRSFLDHHGVGREVVPALSTRVPGDHDQHGDETDHGDGQAGEHEPAQQHPTPAQRAAVAQPDDLEAVEPHAGPGGPRGPLRPDQSRPAEGDDQTQHDDQDGAVEDEGEQQRQADEQPDRADLDERGQQSRSCRSGEDAGRQASRRTRVGHDGLSHRLGGFVPRTLPSRDVDRCTGRISCRVVADRRPGRRPRRPARPRFRRRPRTAHRVAAAAVRRPDRVARSGCRWSSAGRSTGSPSRPD